VSNPVILMLVLAVLALTARSGWTHEQFLESEIVVRTYDPHQLVQGRIIAARQTTNAILHQSGVSLRWWHCDQALPDEDLEATCHMPFRANDLAVRLVRAPSSAGRNALGFSLIDRTDRSWLATVFADRVIATAQRLRLDGEVLLGRTIAHELGHLLLNSSAHAKSGFMRAAWSDAMLTRNVPSDWVFAENHSAFVRRNAGERVLFALHGAPPSPTYPRSY
jgi:hypothetical protein